MHCSKCGATLTTTSGFCGKCGAPIVGYAVGQAVTPSTVAPPSAAYPTATPGYVAPVGVQVAAAAYAGFWLRVAAAIIDGLIISIPTAPFIFMLMFPMFAHLQTPETLQNPTAIMQVILPKFFLLMVIIAVLSWLYWAYLESSSWQATCGKKILGLYVTDLNGNRCTFGKTSARFAAGRLISAVPSIGGLYFLVDCICVAFTERKQAIHDMISACLVMRKS
jgi:uncharacterized RDD family membrane protein YckC